MSDSEEASFMMEEDSSQGEFDSGMEESFEEEEEVAPVTKAKGKKATVAKAAAAKKDSTDSVPKTTVAGGGKKKTVEQIYQKKTQLEHILLRPDTYIGSVVPSCQQMFVLDGDQIVEREITFTPGLFKIFDEIVVNAADNKQRDPNMDRMEISIDAENNLISVKNNGKGIPIEEHKEHNCYVPELIFGHLLTGSNFDDAEKKTTGGRNGYGAKLANVFSTQFIVECVDVERGLFYSQTFSENMTKKSTPTVKKLTAAQTKKGDYVKITFSPELQRFNMTSLDADTVSLLSKRAYDIAGTMANSHGKKLSVYLNDEKLDIKSFETYLKKFRNINMPLSYEKDARWEVAVSYSPDSTMTHVSFVNAISTSKGGGHVTYIADQVAAHLQKVLKPKNKGGTEIKGAQIRNHLAIYVNCLVENPAFDSQTKDFLTTKSKNFGSAFKLSEKFLKKLNKGPLVDTILSYASFKDRQALTRKGGKKKTKLTGITKLDDANNAGTAKSNDCTLIITEGDSAKSLAVSGLSVVGRDFYGVFPLRGKPLNVRDAQIPQVLKNEEIKNLIDIMGLKFEKKYDNDADIKTLRYGHLIIMADQDTDGSHIKGLVINFLHHFWPGLLSRHGFLQQFITPIVKVTKGKKSKTFFNLPEYNSWLESTGNEGKGYNIKYYKGLGTSTSAEAKEYFSHLHIHQINFASLEDDQGDDEEPDNELDNALPDLVKSGSDMIDMVFRKSRVEDRKVWLNTTDIDTFLDYSKVSSEGVRYSDFINKEYILFSRYDNVRSIPHMVDGFKPSQRKVLFGCFKRKLKGEVKVAQLTGYIAEHSAYHHGETSLQGAIVGMAQNFCGSNNINLLTPSGQFGTRRMGGKDAASARYIFTKLEPITRMIFHPDDDGLLRYLTDDGDEIEPEFYMPVIPMVLVNGAEGIGTGWSSSVLNYNPREIVQNIRNKLNGEAFAPMTPYYYGFVGEISEEPNKAGKSPSFTANGKIERVNETTLLISELPIRSWTQDYKASLEKMLTGDGKTEPEIKDFRENHTDTTVSFTIMCEKAKIDQWEKEKNGLPGKFKLTKTMQTSNMTLFNEEGKIHKYEDPRHIMTDFYNLRLNYYGQRKEMLLEKLRVEQRKLSNKARFVEEVCSGDLVVSNRKRKEILGELKSRDYETFFPSKKEKNNNAEDEENEESESADDDVSDAQLAKGYEYLLGMKIWSLTFEKAEQLRKELAEKTSELQKLEATSPSQIWLSDLDDIEGALDDRDSAFAEAQKEEIAAQQKNKKYQSKKAAAKKGKGKKKKADEWDSDLESEDEIEIMNESEDERKPAAKKKLPAKKPAVKRATPKKKLGKASKPASPVNDMVDSMKAQMQISPPPKQPAEGPKKRPPPSPAVEDEDLPLAARIAAKAASSKTANKKVANKKTPLKKKETAAPKKKTIELDDSEDEFDFQSSEDDEKKEEEKSVKPVARARNARARKPIVYAVNDSESDASF